MSVDNNVLGKEYVDAINETLKVRASRCEQYGNTYLDDDYLFLKYQVENKMKRLDIQLVRKGGKESITNKAVALDSAIDAVNYALFIVAKLLKDEQ